MAPSVANGWRRHFHQQIGDGAMKDTVKLSDIPFSTIANVVEYLEADEEKHYAGEPDHIVHSVRRLKKFLYAINPSEEPNAA
jgi:hypothetical protein